MAFQEKNKHSRLLEFEPATPTQLRAAFELLHPHISPHTDIEPNDELLSELAHSYMNPTIQLDAMTLDAIDAEYDGDTDTIYPQTLVLQAHIFYGEMPVAERSLAYVLAHDPVEQTYNGFVLQAFHDAESYPLEISHEIAEFARTVAAHPEQYRDTIDHDQSDITATSYRQTAELRPLDSVDLDLLAAAAQYAHRAQNSY